MDEQWMDLARDNRKAASELVGLGRYRASVSRAYYSVFSKMAQELVNNGVNMPRDWEGPSHGRLRSLIESNLYDKPKEKRQALSRLVGRLYAMRLEADYSPSTAIDSRESREAIAIMNKVFGAF